MKRVLQVGTSGAVNQTTSGFFAVGECAIAFPAAEITAQTKARIAGTYSKLYVYNFAFTGGTHSIRFRKNGANGNMVVPLPGTGAFTDDTNTDDVADGDLICYAMNVSGGTINPSLVSAGFEADDGTVVGHYVSSNSTGAAINVNSTTRSMGVTSLITPTSTTPAPLSQLWRCAGTIKHFQLYISANTRTTTTTFVVMKNGVATSLVITVAAGVTGLREQDTLGNSFTIAPGDTIYFRATTLSGGGTITLHILGISFVSDDGKCQHVNQGVATYVPANANRRAIGGRLFANSEASIRVKVLDPTTYSDYSVYVNTNANVGGGARVHRFRKNTADANQLISVGTETVQWMTDAVNTDSAVADDLISTDIKARSPGGTGNDQFTMTGVVADYGDPAAGDLVLPNFLTSSTNIFNPEITDGNPTNIIRPVDPHNAPTDVFHYEPAPFPVTVRALDAEIISKVVGLGAYVPIADLGLAVGDMIAMSLEAILDIQDWYLFSLHCYNGAFGDTGGICYTDVIEVEDVWTRLASVGEVIPANTVYFRLMQEAFFEMQADVDIRKVKINRGTSAGPYTPPLWEVWQSFLSSPSEVFEPTLVAGEESDEDLIQPSFLADASTIFAPSIGTILSLGFLSSPATVHSPTLILASRIEPPLLAGGGTVFSPSIGTIVSLTFLSSPSVVFTPEVKEADVVQATFLASLATIPAPTLKEGDAVAPGFLGSPATVYGPSIGTILSLGFLSSASTVFAPALAEGEGIQPPKLVAPSTVFAPSIGTILSLSFLASPSPVHAPAVRAAIRVEPTFLAAPATVYRPAITEADQVLVPFVPSLSLVFAPRIVTVVDASAIVAGAFVTFRDLTTAGQYRRLGTDGTMRDPTSIGLLQASRETVADFRSTEMD